MRIGIIGAGSVGGALGRGWIRAGHEVTFGVRNPSDPKTAKLREETGARAVSVAEAAAAGTRFAAGLGFDPVDAGNLEQARLLERSESWTRGSESRTRGSESRTRGSQSTTRGSVRPSAGSDGTIPEFNGGPR